MGSSYYPKSITDRVDARCADDPHAEQLRQLLLDAERRAHATGWGGPNAPPRLFEVHEHRDKPEFSLRWPSALQAFFLRFAPPGAGVSVSKALIACAETMESATATTMRGDVPDEAVAWMARAKGTSEQAVREWLQGLRVAVASGGDLLQSPEPSGYRFHGLGLRTEGTGIVGCYDEDEISQVFARRRRGMPVADMPESTELRFVYYVARDGLTWSVMRVRGGTPQCVFQMPESDAQHVGAVPHALGRMVNTLISNRIPVLPAGLDFPGPPV